MPRPAAGGGECDMDFRTKAPTETKDGESDLRPKDGLPPHGASAWRESEFQLWLEQKLASERGAFILRLQSVIREQLSSHHSALLEEIEGHVGNPGGYKASSAARHRSSPLDKVQEHASASVSTDSPGSADMTAAPSLLVSPDASSQAYLSLRSEDRSLLCTRLCSGSTGKTGTPNTPTSSRITPKSSTSKKRHSYKSAYISYLSPSRTKLGLGSGVNRIERMVFSHYFEFLSCLMILLNMVIMSFEVQYTGCGLAHSIQHPDSSTCMIFEEIAIDAIFNVVAVVFCGFFTIEFLLRLYALGRQAICSAWMWFDIIVLTFGIVDSMGRLGSQLDLAVNPSAMRTARVARMLRLVKVFRGKEAFQVFFLLMKSLLASRHALGWSLSILFVAMTCTGLLMNQLLYTYLSDPNHPLSDRRLVFEYFGTYTRMIITMFEITLGNWTPPTRVLMENISQLYGVFITAYRCLFCFALVNVSSAVFITETSRVASDDEVLMMRKQRTEKRTAQVLQEVFTEIDTSCDGVMTLEELRSALEDELMMNLLEILELDGSDMEELFNVLDKGGGRVAREDFIGGVLRLRGQAKTSKLVAMMMVVKNMDGKLEALSKGISSIEHAVVGGSAHGKGRSGGSRE